MAAEKVADSPPPYETGPQPPATTSTNIALSPSVRSSPSSPTAVSPAHYTHHPPSSKPSRTLIHGPDGQTHGYHSFSQLSVAVEGIASTTSNMKPSKAEPETTESQAMQATTSSSSSGSQKGTPSGNGTNVSPYGTRSTRQRTNGARPNYAEDREMDVDYDLGGTARISKSKPSTAAAAATQPSSLPVSSRDQSSSGISTRRASTTATNRITPTSTGQQNGSSSRDTIPGTSTFVANPTAHKSSCSTPTAPPSKKRKTAATGVACTTPPISSSNTVARKASTRRANIHLAEMRTTNMLSFQSSGAFLKDGKLTADDGTTLELNDHVYLISEPPGDPYFLCRIMEFVHSDNDRSRPVDTIRVNWYYRPRDILRQTLDTRLLFASMHSDTCPLTSLRGKCSILHRSEIRDLDEFRKAKDCFWYEKSFDRYNRRYYDIIPTSLVINVPAKVKKVLDEQWRFILVEMGRGKELTAAVKACKRCSGYCANNDSVECAVCHMTYHMNCVRPPLLKKPSRGFAWACAPCNRLQERKLEARNTPRVGDATEIREEEVYDEEEEEEVVDSSRGSPSQDDEINVPTEEQAAHAKMWPFRYLGQHCDVMDALDYDDRIYPRVGSRIGARHQVVVPPWQGRPVEYVKKVEIKKKYLKGGGGSHKKDAKLTKETIALLEADKKEREARPRWVVDEPPGYIRRGEDCEPGDPNGTSELKFTIPELGQAIDLSRSEEHRGEAHREGIQKLEAEAKRKESLVDDLLTQCQGVARRIGIKPYFTNFLDKESSMLYKQGFDVEQAREKLERFSKKKDFGEPDFNREEQKRFEDGISRFGSKLPLVSRHVRTQKMAEIVRYYYLWKKTEKGQHIWGNFSGRKGKKEAKMVEAAGSEKLSNDVADDVDDSAFDSVKAAEQKRGFFCKFCLTKSSPQWRRAPAVGPGAMAPADVNAKASSKEKGQQLLLALCYRCGELWRRYAVHWEDIDEVARKVAQGGGRAWKRRIDEELLKELLIVNESSPFGDGLVPNSVSLPAPNLPETGPEPARKKHRAAPKDETAPLSSGTSSNKEAPMANSKKKVLEKAKEREVPPAPPQMPKPKTLPCFVCNVVDPFKDQLLQCKECRMSVHASCYGVLGEVRLANKWTCDMCANDKNPTISTTYECVLCPVRCTEHDFIEPPKISHKKKTDRERERERLEREMAVTAAEHYRKKQAEVGRPMDPYEPLKRTAGNNWVHVTCAIWTPEVKFGQAKALAPSEGIGLIPAARHEQVCKVCQTREGACVGCHQCHAPVHVACAHSAGYHIGFDITPVKGSRRDVVNTVTLGNECGSMTAAIWCREHAVKTIIHPMHEVVDHSGLQALQLYVRNYKQADLTLTGTVRKANLVNQSTKAIAQGPTAAVTIGNRRASTTYVNGTISSGRRGSATTEENDVQDARRVRGDVVAESIQRRCITCDIDVSPKWWPVEQSVDRSRAEVLTNGHAMVNGDSHRPVVSNGQTSNVVEDKSSGEVMASGLLPNDAPTESCSRAVRCHQCHWRKLRQPSPIIPVEPQRVSPTIPARVREPSVSHPSELPIRPSQSPPILSRAVPHDGRSPNSPQAHTLHRSRSHSHHHTLPHERATSNRAPSSPQTIAAPIIGSTFIGWHPQGYTTSAPLCSRAPPPTVHHAASAGQTSPRAPASAPYFGPPAPSPQMHSRTSSGGESIRQQEDHVERMPAVVQSRHGTSSTGPPPPPPRKTQFHHHHHRQHSLTGSPSPSMRNGVPPMTPALHQQTPTSSQMINGTHPSHSAHPPHRSPHASGAPPHHSQPYTTQQQAMRLHQSTRSFDLDRYGSRLIDETSSTAPTFARRDDHSYREHPPHDSRTQRDEDTYRMHYHHYDPTSHDAASYSHRSSRKRDLANLGSPTSSRITSQAPTSSHRPYTPMDWSVESEPRRDHASTSRSAESRGVGPSLAAEGNTKPGDGRSTGGASASPSLKNLLS